MYVTSHTTLEFHSYNIFQKDSFEFCDKNSSDAFFRIPNPHDCSKYRECAVTDQDSIRIGFYVEKQCAYGSQFEPGLHRCSQKWVHIRAVPAPIFVKVTGKTELFYTRYTSGKSSFKSALLY